MIRALLCATAAVATLATPAWADRYILSFEGSAFGFVPLGAATIDIGMDDARYQARARLRSGGLSALFDRTDLIAESAGRADGAVAWEEFVLDHSYAQKHRLTRMRRGEAPEIRPTFRFWGAPPPSEAQKAESRDPLAAIVAMAAQAGATGTCAGRFPVFDGRYRYDLILRSEGRDRHRGGGFDGPVVKCKMRYKPVAGYEADTDMGRRIPEGEIWFALVEGARFAPPVRITAPLPLGHAAIRLTGFRKAQVEVGAAEAVAEGPSPPSR